MRTNTLAGLLPAVLLTFLAYGPVDAAILYVSRDAPGPTHDGATWNTAFTTVQAAVDAGANGDEVWVAAGTYKESVLLTKSLSLFGGFAGTETARGERDPMAHVTVLDGGGTGRVLYAHFDPSTLPAVIDGFTITNGATSFYWNDAAALYAESPLTISHNIITRNQGNGILLSGSARYTVTDNTVSGNTLSGVYLSSSAPSLVARNRFTGNGGTPDNTASAAIWLTYGTPADVSDNLIAGNNRAGIMIGDTGRVRNNTIASNASAGIVIMVMSTAISLSNNIITFNDTGVALVTIGIDEPFHNCRNNDVFGNIRWNYRHIVDPTGQNGNISADPLFVDAAHGDYHLLLGSTCINGGDDASVQTGDTDLEGFPRMRDSHVDMGAYEAPSPLPAISVALGTAVSAPPTVVDGVAYIDGNDGKLYAYTSPDLKPVAGFPVDINAAVGAAVTLNSRPAVYYGSTGKAIYLTTDKGQVVRVLPTGQVAWVAKPLNGPTMSTPAVTPAGNVYVDLGLQSGASVLSFLFKLDEATGLSTYASPYLGSSPATSLSDRSAAIDQRYCYVNASSQGMGSLAVLNQDNLTVRASFAPGEDALPPYLAGSILYLATRAGNVYKLNGTTMNPDLSFGSMGQMRVGEGITAGPFGDGSGHLYVGTSSGNVYSLDRNTGAKMEILFSLSPYPVTGLLVLHGSTIVLCRGSGTLVQVPLGGATGTSTTSLEGPPAGGPSYDPFAGRVLAVTTTGRLYSIPAL